MKNLILGALALFVSSLVFAAAAPDVTEVVPTGATVAMSAQADGNPTPTLEWQRNGVKVGEGTTFTFKASEDTAGTYQVVATNSLGSATSNKLTFTAGKEPSTVVIKFVISIEVAPSAAPKKQ